MTEQDAQRYLLNANEKTLGDIGEWFWQAVFRNSTVGYIPLAKIANGGAPRVELTNGGVVVPDFDCSADRWCAFVDSKCKKNVVLWRRSRQLRHGIDKSHWEQYLECSRRYRKRCAIGVFECFDDNDKWSGEYMIETFDELSAPYFGESNQAHMVYWAKKAFRNLGMITASELSDIIHGRKKAPPCSYELEMVFARPKQGDLF